MFIGGDRVTPRDTGYALSSVCLTAKCCGISGLGDGVRSTECRSSCVRIHRHLTDFHACHLSCFIYSFSSANVNQVMRDSLRRPVFVIL